jgi:tetratricopeptide (TPR) repeat protein
MEAIAQAERGLVLIADLPASSDRRHQELELRLTQAGALMGVKGYAHPAVIEAFDRARSLVVETDAAGTISHFSVLYGLWAADYVDGRPRSALERSKEFLSLAKSQTDSGILLKGYQLVGTTLMIIGDYAAALLHLEQAAALYMPEQHSALGFLFGADIGVGALGAYSLALWYRGYPEHAREIADETLRHARRLGHLRSLARALFDTSRAATSWRQAEKVEKLAGELIAVADEQGFVLFWGWGLIFQG